MTCYEHVFITRPDITAQQVEALTDTLTKVVEENGGKVANTEYWGLRTMAYPIKKNKKAHYVMMNLEAPHPAILETERQERLNEDVMRFMTIRVDEHKEGPSIMMQKPDRRHRDDDNKGKR
jgi:small subunit ribosomal protein S6